MLPINRILMISDDDAAHSHFHTVIVKGIKKNPGAPGNKRKNTPALVSFQVDDAYREEEAMDMVRKACEEDHPYALIFIEMSDSFHRINGKLISGILEQNSRTGIIICEGGKRSPGDPEMNKPGWDSNVVIINKLVEKSVVQHLMVFILEKWKIETELGKKISDVKDEVMKKTEQIEKLFKRIHKEEEEKTQFYINFAHDAKTPLTLIKNHMDNYIAKKKETDNDLHKVKYMIDTFLKDVVNLLDAKKLERGQIYYNHEQLTNLAELTEIKVVLFREIARKKKISITSSVEPGILIHADPYAVDRVLNNLLDNAVKYSPPGGSIHVLVKRDHNRVLLGISDTGSGIEESQLKNIFRPYYQLTHKKRSLQGIGMGLFIIKKIIDTIGATITVTSELNKGTGFKIYFKESAKTVLKQHNLDNEYSSPLDREYSFFRHPAGISINKEEKHPDKKNILLVDDNVEILQLLHSSLKQIYNVYFFTNGNEALNNLQAIPSPDIIISDIMMDIMDGHEFFRRLSVNKDYYHIPFIFLTVKNTINEKISSIKDGAVDYIYKPFVMEELIAKIEAILRQKEKYDLQKFKNRFASACREYEITSREKDVLALLIEGFLYKEIGNKLTISIKTVEYHIHNIYKKFSVQNIAELIRKIM